jgi:hypothetical protein
MACATVIIGRHAETEVESLQATIDKAVSAKFRPCDISKEIESLKSGKAFSFDFILNKCLRHLPRRPLLHLRYLFNHCLRLCHFPTPLKEAKFITLQQTRQRPKIFPKLTSDQPIVHYQQTILEQYHLRDRETRTSCSMQTATRPHCSVFVVWALWHIDQWSEIPGDLFFQKA